MSIALHSTHQTGQRFSFHPPLVVSNKLLTDISQKETKNQWRLAERIRDVL
jgi:hypothetical protein